MRVSVNWLKELIDVRMSVEELAHTLTMAGLEVEEISPVAADFTNVVVAEVKAASTHPDANKLSVCEVDAGTGQLLQIVCGAPNVVVGMRVPCAVVGAKLPGLEIKQAKLRGIDSHGMLCSARELGLSDEHAGLLRLSDDAPIGQDIRKYLDLDDTYLTLKLTPNRGDCLSMVGIARDLAAVTGAVLTLPEVAANVSTNETNRGVSISAPAACGRYTGRVIKGLVTTAMTPGWMKRRLERAGFRTISPLVDITNYVNLERGQPMHAFDDDRLSGDIEVRYAQMGEAMNLLNAQQVALQPDMLLVTDASGPIALAGVMGGLESMVTPESRNVFFESAFFCPDAIRGKSRALGINSDAAHRFERGVDPEGARAAMEYATKLALEICGAPATIIGPISEAVGERPSNATISVRPARVEHLLGMRIPTEEMGAILRRLNCDVREDGGTLLVTPPCYRFDLKIEEDFVEEIARISGYEKLPAQPPKSALPMLPISDRARSRSSIRHFLVAMGYQEVINYSFTPPEWELDFAGNATPIEIANPISNQMSAMRTNLFGGLVEVLRHNLNHGESRLKLFELGRCFLRDVPTLEAQPEMLAGLVYGQRFPEQWGEGGQKGIRSDFHSVKGEVESLLSKLRPVFKRFSHSALHPGRAASISIAGKPAGVLGELHPQLQQKYELPFAPIMFELDTAAMRDSAPPFYAPISRLPTVRRDIAVVVDDAVEMQSMLDAVNAMELPAVVEFSPFDLYKGENLVPGKKSVAFRILMRDTERTLVDSEADKNVFEILQVLYKEFGATLRK